MRFLKIFKVSLWLFSEIQWAVGKGASKNFSMFFFCFAWTVLLGVHKKSGCCTWEEESVHHYFQNTFPAYSVFPRQLCFCSGIFKMVPDVSNANNRSCVCPCCILQYLGHWGKLGDSHVTIYMFVHAWAFPDDFSELYGLYIPVGGWKINGPEH